MAPPFPVALIIRHVLNMRKVRPAHHPAKNQRTFFDTEDTEKGYEEA
jgi:hypothetical protein